MSRSDGYGIRRRKLFLTFDGEPPTRSALTGLLASAIRLALPLLNPAARRDFGRRLRRRQNASIHGWGAGFRQKAPAALTPSERLNIQLSKSDTTSRLPLGARLESTRPRKVPSAPSLIPESHRDRPASMSCCRIDVVLLSSCCRFDATFLESYPHGVLTKTR